MPCYDGAAEMTAAEERANEFESLLCGIATVLEQQNMLDNVLRAVNWSETGLGRYHFDRWWHDHKVQDKQRRMEDQAQKEAEKLRQSVLSKLTPEERRVLGIKM